MFGNTKNQIAKLKTLREEGLPIWVIAENLGVSETSIYRWLKSEKIPEEKNICLKRFYNYYFHGNESYRPKIHSIGAIWEGAYGAYFKSNTFFGDILYFCKETQTYYKIHGLSITNPLNPNMAGLKSDISINLNNEKQAEFLGSDVEECHN